MRPEDLCVSCATDINRSDKLIGRMDRATSKAPPVRTKLLGLRHGGGLVGFYGGRPSNRNNCGGGRRSVSGDPRERRSAFLYFFRRRVDFFRPQFYHCRRIYCSNLAERSLAFRKKLMGEYGPRDQKTGVARRGAAFPGGLGFIPGKSHCSGRLTSKTGNRHQRSDPLMMWFVFTGRPGGGHLEPLGRGKTAEAFGKKRDSAPFCGRFPGRARKNTKKEKKPLSGRNGLPRVKVLPVSFCR